jgi:hypothetical protein
VSQYKEVLHKWAIKFIETHRRGADVAQIVDVKFEEFEASGYCDTCWSPGFTAIEIDYIDSRGAQQNFYETSEDEGGFKMGNILTELFAIAEKEE